MKIKILCALFLSIVFISSAYAEELMSLDEAVRTALSGNPALRAGKKGIDASKKEIDIARSYLLPKLTFEERYLRTDNPTYAFSAKLNQERFAMSDFAIDNLNNPDPISDYQSSISLEQPIYVRKTYLGLKMAKTEADAKELEYRRKKEQVALDVIKAYIGVQIAQAYKQALERALEDALEHKRIVEARLSVGAGLYSDSLRVDVAVKSAEEGLLKAEKNLKIAKRALGLMLGLDEPVGIKDEIQPSVGQDIDLYLKEALNRDDLLALQKRLANAQNAVKLASADYVPIFGIGGSYQWNDHNSAFGSEGKSYIVMAFMRWNLFDGLRRESEIEKARLQAQEVEEYLSGLKKEISYRVYEAYLAVEEAGKALELSNARLVSAEEGARLLKVRFENSLATIVELLDAQTSLDMARADLVEKKGNYLRSIAELEFASGLLLKRFQ